MPTEEELRRLVDALDGDDAGEAHDAQAELVALGAGDYVTRRLPDLDVYGTLCAIEILERLDHVAAGPALVDLLRHENDTVRTWAAWALVALGHEAVPELRVRAAALVAERVPPDWLEPCAVREALTAFGARAPVVPDPVARTAERVGRSTGWPASSLEELVEALAGARQVVLAFSVWQRDERYDLLWRQHDRLGWEFSYALAWEENIRQAREAALVEASALPDARDGLVVMIEWIDESDVANV